MPMENEFSHYCDSVNLTPVGLSLVRGIRVSDPTRKFVHGPHIEPIVGKLNRRLLLVKFESSREEKPLMSLCDTRNFVESLIQEMNLSVPRPDIDAFIGKRNRKMRYGVTIESRTGEFPENGAQEEKHAD